MPKNPNEKRVPMKSVAVKYICEFCHEGEQIALEAEIMKLDDGTLKRPPMVKHRCNKCGREMMLPRPYPYLEWVEDLGSPVDGTVHFVNE